jgi:hypothetical protein
MTTTRRRLEIQNQINKIREKERLKNMGTKSPTIIALIIGLILLIGGYTGVSLTEGELQTTIETITKIGQMVAMFIALFSGKKELHTDFLGNRK